MTKMFSKRRLLAYLVIAVTLFLAVPQLQAFANDAEAVATATSPMYATFWALVPPVIAIVLALITKEVYFSLFIGIVFGAMFCSNFNFEDTLETIFVHGMIAEISMDSDADAVGNAGILIFLVMLGIMVSLMNKVGGSAAYGRWAATKIKGRKGAMLSTLALGVVIFVDDYFNCLTVGSVMRPVTDKFKISRAKLAYIIDSTAAPVCILAPISSWAAAVSGLVEGESGFALFVRSIPYNYYALLTILMIVLITLLGIDFGPMKKHEDNAVNNDDLYTTDARPYAEVKDEEKETKGKVIDLILPVVILIVCCVLGILYTGGFFRGVSLFEAFEKCDAMILVF